MKISPEQAAEVWAQADLLHGPQAVNAAVERMAADISTRLGRADPLVLTVMNGGVVLAGSLLPRLKFPLRLDYVHASRYRGDITGGSLNWIRRPSEPLEGRVVLLVDDILDEGITLAEIVRDCRHHGVREVLSAVLVEKRHDRKNGFCADFVGLEVEDRYVFGCGMDYHGYLRNADGIYAVAGL